MNSALDYAIGYALGRPVGYAASRPQKVGAVTEPDAPTSVVATAGDEEISFAFTPGDDGGSPITGYTVTPYVDPVVEAYDAGITLSNGNLTATVATDGNFYSAKTTIAHSTGKHIIKLTANYPHPAAWEEHYAGFVLASQDVQSELGDINNEWVGLYALSASLATSGVVWHNLGANNVALPYLTGEYMLGLYDADTGDVWFATATGVTGDPEAGTGAVANLGPGASVVFADSMYTGDIGVGGINATIDPTATDVRFPSFLAWNDVSDLAVSGPSSPIIVSGLINGNEYTGTVHATNAVGDSPESAASNAVTPILMVHVIEEVPVGNGTGTLGPVVFSSIPSDGETLLMFVCRTAAPTVVPPGFSLVASWTSGAGKTYCYTKTAASETNSYQFNSVSRSCVLGVRLNRGVFDTSGGADGVSVTSLLTPSPGIVVPDGSYVVAGWHFGSANPAGGAVNNGFALKVNSQTFACRSYIASRIYPSGGASEQVTLSWSTALSPSGMMVVIKPQ